MERARNHRSMSIHAIVGVAVVAFCLASQWTVADEGDPSEVVAVPAPQPSVLATAAGPASVEAEGPEQSSVTPARPVPVVTCSSKVGERQHCAADTSKGVIFVKSVGEAPCLLGKTWGYDDQGIWVSDGCSGV